MEPTTSGAEAGGQGKAAELLKNLLSEENCDLLIDLVLDKVKLPFWIPKAMIRAALYKMLPGVLMEAVAELEAKLG